MCYEVSRECQTIWARPCSWNAERKDVLIAVLCWCPSIDSDFQSMAGRLRSPLIQMVADLLVFTMCLILLQRSSA